MLPSPRLQVRDLAFFIEAQKTISDAAGGELKEGTLLPLPQVWRASGDGQRGVSMNTDGYTVTLGGG